MPYFQSLLLIICVLLGFSGEQTLGSAYKTTLRDSKLLHYVGQIRTDHPESPKGYATCSASRIGRRLILTAEHCLPFTNGRLDTYYHAYFYPSMQHGHMPRRARSAKIIRVWTGQTQMNRNSLWENPDLSQHSHELHKDWAIALLDKEPFEDDYENRDFMAVGQYRGWSRHRLKAVGYGPNGETSNIARIDNNCYEVRMQSTAPYYYPVSCFATGGDSGGPAVVRTNNGQYIQVGIINMGNMLNSIHSSNDPLELLIGLLVARSANIPADFRSFLLASENFFSTLRRVKSQYNELHENRYSQSNAQNHESSSRRQSSPKKMGFWEDERGFYHNGVYQEKIPPGASLEEALEIMGRNLERDNRK